MAIEYDISGLVLEAAPVPLAVTLAPYEGQSLPQDDPGEHEPYSVSDLQTDIYVVDNAEPPYLTGTVKQLTRYDEVTLDQPCHVLALTATYNADATYTLSITKEGVTETLTPFSATTSEGVTTANYAVAVDGADTLTASATMGEQSIEQAFDLTTLTLETIEEGPALDFMAADMSYANKTASEIQAITDVTYDDQDDMWVPAGTVTEITGWTDYSDDPDEQDGYFLMATVEQPSAVTGIKLISSPEYPEDVLGQYTPDENNIICAHVKFGDDGEGHLITTCALVLEYTDPGTQATASTVYDLSSLEATPAETPGE